MKWQIPTGTLYDLLCDEGEYPWSLIIHFRAYPREVLQPVRGSGAGEDALQAAYLNSLKEAAYVLTGNSNSIMSLTKKSQQELWTNVLEGQHKSFFSNMQKMDLTKPMVGQTACLFPSAQLLIDCFLCARVYGLNKTESTDTNKNLCERKGVRLLHGLAINRLCVEITANRCRSGRGAHCKAPAPAYS